MVPILNQISNQLRNTSDPVPDSNEDASDGQIQVAIIPLTLSLGLVWFTIILSLWSKAFLWQFMGSSGTHHNPEEQARSRELRAQRLSRAGIPTPFAFLLLIMLFCGQLFFLGFALTIDTFSSLASLILLISMVVLLGAAVSSLLFLGKDLQPVNFSPPSGQVARVRVRSLFRRSSALDPEIVDVGISNCLFTHTAMVPKNFSIFTQLFGIPIKHPRCRITSLVPWSQLSSTLPSVLSVMYSQSKFNLLPALRLCLVVCGQNQSEQVRGRREAKGAYSTIKTSDPLQNLYLLLLLSRLHVTTEDTDHWQDACRILKCLEYSEENTSELVWLVDSIQLYTLEIKEDFTTRIVEFLRGVVVYLAKCPGDNHNGDLLRTATIMAAEWLISCQSPDNGNLPRRYILSRQDVHSDGKNREMFALVDNQTLCLSERLRRVIALYQGSQKRDSSLDFVIRTLLIPIMAIDSFAAEKEGKSISDAVPCIQRDDLRCSLEGLWDIWEGGFNRSDLLRFVLASVVPPSSTGGTQSSMVVLLLNGYLQQVNGPSDLITEKALRFIHATLEHSLTTGTTQGELDLQLRELRSLDPWISLHIDTILGHSFTSCVADLERATTLNSRVKAIVARKRLNLYLSSNIDSEPDILTLLVQSDDPEISLEAFGQGVNLLESALTDESDGQNPGSPRPFTFTLLEQDKRSHLISCFFDPQQSTSMCQSVWIMFTEDLYPRWGLLPANWRRDIATALVAATEWMEKSQAILAEEIKRRHASGKAKLLIGATVLALVNYGDIGHHWMRKIPLEARDERFQERLDACAQVYLRLFATAIEELGESAKPHTQDIVNFLVNIPDVLYNGGAIKRIQHALGIPRKM
jgi:hypothetical protein